jgi:hypothetical protein
MATSPRSSTNEPANTVSNSAAVIRPPPAWLVGCGFAIGAILIGIAILIRVFSLDLPYTKVLFYCGVAALLSVIGSTGSFSWKVSQTGQVLTATGAAAVGIILCYAIGADPPPVFNMKYYFQIPQTVGRPDDLVAQVDFFRIGKIGPVRSDQSPVDPSPGGAALEVSVNGVSADELMKIHLKSSGWPNGWSSSKIHPNECFMLFAEDHGS